MAVRAGRLVWLGHLLDVQKVAGSNPVRPTTEFSFAKEHSSRKALFGVSFCFKAFSRVFERLRFILRAFINSSGFIVTPTVFLLLLSLEYLLE